ncbi:hypothetical protein TNCV_1331291 [Trichonephila clavipes]|nr:hypothetical protein TNCV_1331291 [Trichonephila clavipes]
MPAGWYIFFRASLIRWSSWVQLRPKSVDFHGAKNQQRPSRTIMSHVKDILSAYLVWMLSAKFVIQFHLVRALVPPNGEEIERHNYIVAIDIHLYGVALKLYKIPENVQGLQC